MPEIAPMRWPALMSVHSVAAYTDLSESTIKKLHAMGKLPPAVVMPADLRSTRWLRSDIDEMLSTLAKEKP